MATHRRLAEVEDNDFYITPAWSSHALMVLEHFDGSILEPCCGDGAISKVINLYHEGRCHSQDLIDRGYGKNKDFFKHTKSFDNIITNPPFNIANDIVLHALPLARKKLCLLLRLAFLEGSARHGNIFSINPPTRVWVFTERVSMYKANVNKKSGGTTAYAWFVWDQTKNKNKQKTELHWIPPGFKTLFP